MMKELELLKNFNLEEYSALEILSLGKTDLQTPIEYKGYLIKLGENGFYFQDEYGVYVVELIKEWDSIKDDITKRFYQLNPNIQRLD